MKRNFDLIRKSVMLCLLLAAATPMFGQITVEMKKEGGVFYLPGKVNGLQLEFIFDTGASDVYLSLTEFIFMLKNGYLTEEDIKGESYSMVASGETVRNTDVLLREIEIAGIKIYNVTASVSENLGAPLLLGQSAIQKLGPIQLEGNKLIISNGKDFPSEQKAQDYLLRGAQQVEATNYEAAIATLQKGLDMSKDLNIRSGLYCNMVAAYAGLKNREKAIEYCHKGLEENPMNQELGYNLGVYLFETGKNEQAERAFQTQIQRFANDPSAHKRMIAASYSYLGDIQYSSGKFVEAEENYIKSIAIEPYSKPYLGLGDIYFEQEKYAQAAENYEKGIAFEPHRPSNIIRYNQLGRAYFFSNQKDKARKAFWDCLDVCKTWGELIPEAIDSARASGDMRMQMQYTEMILMAMNSELWLARSTPDANEVLSCYNRVLPGPFKSDLNVHDYINMGRAYYTVGKQDSAKIIFTEACDLFPNSIDAKYYLAMSRDSKDSDRLTLLMQIFDYGAQLQSPYFDYGEICYEIANYYRNTGKYAEGIPFAEKAVTSHSDYAAGWWVLGVLYYASGDYENCIKAMTGCLLCEDEINQGINKEALTFRGNAYLKLGQKRKGQADLDAAANL